jgi:signal transduction histidine kinase
MEKPQNDYNLDRTDSRRKRDQEDRLRGQLAKSDATLKTTREELKASSQELKVAELQLIQAAKGEAIATVSAGIAHEVRNPLQTILMGLHYLNHNLGERTETVSLVLTEMQDAVERANAIVQDLLKLSAPADLQMRVGDLNSLVDRSLALVHGEMVASQIMVSRDWGAGLPEVAMDARKMEQVFLALFINARQAMPRGGTLTVSTRDVLRGPESPEEDPALRQFSAGERLVVVRVEDTGTGIPFSALPKLFEPFFTTKPAGVGTGLGLPVVKKILDLHGGAVYIRNVRGGGARAEVWLRAAQEENHGKKTNTHC